MQKYKIEKVDEIKKKLENAKSIVFVDYMGIDASEDYELRKLMKENDVEYFVAKNSFIKLAVKDKNIDNIDGYLKGSTAIAVSSVDEALPAKVIYKFCKEVLEGKDYYKFKFGYVDNVIFNEKQLNALALLPSKDELLAKVLGSLNAPITNFVGVSSGIIRKFIYALKGVMDKK